MKKLTLFNKNCLNVVERLPDQSIDLVLIDPPYRNTVSYAVSTGGNKHFNRKQSPFFFFVKYLFSKLKIL